MQKHLIHIGYPKAASTFLQEWFKLHPQLRFNQGAIAGFYNIFEVCRVAAQNQDINIKYFVTSYEGLVAPNAWAGSYPTEYGKVGFIVSGYRDLQVKVCNQMKETFPNSQILMITRGFKKMLLSAFSQYVRCGGIMCWETFYEKYFESNKQVFSELFDYSFVYKLYADAFGEENLIVVPYELLKDDQDIFISFIEERLGLDHFAVNIGKIYESLSAEELYWYPRISYRVSKFVQLFGDKRFHKIYSLYIHQINNQRLRKLAQALCYLRTITPITEPDDVKFIEKIVGNAEIFRHNPLYQPYLKEYFLD